QLAGYSVHLRVTFLSSPLRAARSVTCASATLSQQSSFLHHSLTFRVPLGGADTIRETVLAIARSCSRSAGERVCRRQMLSKSNRYDSPLGSSMEASLAIE